MAVYSELLTAVEGTVPKMTDQEMDDVDAELNGENGAFDPEVDEYETVAETTSLLRKFSPTLTVAIASLVFYWIDFPITSTSIATLAIAGFAAFGFWRPLNMLQAYLDFFFKATFFHCAYVLYIAALVATTLYLKDFSTGLRPTLTVIMFFVLYLSFGARLTTLTVDCIKRSVLCATPAALIGFIVYAQFVFQSLGTNLLTALADAMQGQGAQVAARSIKVIVNFDSATGGSVDETLAKTGSVRNSISAVLFTYVFASLASFISYSKFQWRFWAGAFVTVAAPCILLVLMSRSNLIALAVSFVLSGILAALLPTATANFRGWVLFAIVGAIAGVGVLGFLAQELTDSDLIAANLDRFSAMAEDPRIANYREVIDDLIASPWQPRGIGAKMSDGLAVHNLLLAAWYEAGIIGLVSGFTFFIALLFTSISLLRQRLIEARLPLMQFAFGAALVVNPILRRLIGGDGGRPTLLELVAIAVFIVFMTDSRSFGQQGDDEEFDSHLDTQHAPMEGEY